MELDGTRNRRWIDFGVTNIYSTSADKYTNRASSHLFSMLKNDKRTDEKEQAIGQFLEFIRQNSIEWAKAGQIVASKQVIESPEYSNYIQSFFTANEKKSNPCTFTPTSTIHT